MGRDERVRVQRIKRRILLLLLALATLPWLLAVPAWMWARDARAAYDQARWELTEAHGMLEAARAALETLEAAPPPEPEAPPEPAEEPEPEAQPAGYQLLYPALYAGDPPAFADPQEEAVYLTFDDGPSPMTGAILDALDRYGAKATFFVVGRQVERYPEQLREIVRRGHAVGVHSDSHDFARIYRSVEDFLADLSDVCAKVESTCGVKPELLRFPGGSVNGYNQGLYMEFIAEVARRGFRYYDWNVSAEDAVAAVPSAQEILERMLGPIRSNSRSIVLMHDGDGHGSTVEALEELLRQLTAEGFRFRALDRTVKPVIFSYH